MTISIARTPYDLRRIDAELSNLAAHSLEENPFYEGWFLQLSLEHLAAPHALVVIVWHDDTAIGVFPLAEESIYRHLPIRHLTLWRHILCFSCTPLIRKGFEDECLSAFLHWVSAHPLGRYVFRFEHVAGNRILAALQSFAKHRDIAVDFIENDHRPLFLSVEDTDTYLRNAMSGRHVRDTKRKKSKLESMGVLTCERLSSSHELEQWISDFLVMEVSGWKGREKSALAQHSDQKSFFEASCREAFRRGKLEFHRMILNGNPIAMRTGFRGEEGVFSFKIAFDETFAAQSPGLLLDIYFMETLATRSDLRWIDSCALPGHSSLSRIYLEQQPVASMAFSTEALWSRYIVAAATGLKRLKDLTQRTPSLDPETFSR